DAIAEWLIGPARRIESGVRALDEFAWRMLAAGLPLLRVTLHTSTLHPQYLGATFTWFRTIARAQQIASARRSASAMNNGGQRPPTGSATGWSRISSRGSEPRRL